ncbi:hypothetical protein O5478_18205 [Escherichia coli]|nr:hypothetical protein [Escherichia coli]
MAWHAHGGTERVFIGNHTDPPPIPALTGRSPGYDASPPAPPVQMAGAVLRPAGSENNVLGEFVQLTQLFRDNKAVLLIANHHLYFRTHVRSGGRMVVCSMVRSPSGIKLLG